jgi:hypothetical protein
MAAGSATAVATIAAARQDFTARLHDATLDRLQMCR